MRSDTLGRRQFAPFFMVDPSYQVVEYLGTFPTFKTILFVLLLVGGASEFLPASAATVLQLVFRNAAHLHVTLGIARVTEVFAAHPTLREVSKV